MSRIGKKPVTVPAGVTVTINGPGVSVKGPKGELQRSFSDLVTVTLEDEQVLVTRNDDTQASNAQQGLTRTLVHNMVVGVSEGFEKKLELTGVGYRAALKGKDLDLSLGYSHPVLIEPPEGITFAVDGNTKLSVSGIDKQKVGQIAAIIRKLRKDDPYKGKGIRYEGEQIRRKVGKTGK